MDNKKEALIESLFKSVTRSKLMTKRRLKELLIEAYDAGYIQAKEDIIKEAEAKASIEGILE